MSIQREDFQPGGAKRAWARAFLIVAGVWLATPYVLEVASQVQSVLDSADRIEFNAAAGSGSEAMRTALEDKDAAVTRLIGVMEGLLLATTLGCILLGVFDPATRVLRRYRRSSED